MNRPISRTAASAALVLIFCGCITRRAPEVTLENDLQSVLREIELLPPFPTPASSSGSLWTDGGPGAALFRDTRAYRTNDLLTIRVDERSLGTNESQTDLNRTSGVEMGASVAFGLEGPTQVPGKFGISPLLSGKSDSVFAGDGRTTRSSQLSGLITARVARVLPNGDLIIAGQKTVVVNRERQILTLVGSVRAVDVNSDNQVSSGMIGQLTVQLWGRGELDDTARQGWLQRLMNRIWPL